jgi:hypothetical protein
MAVIVGRKKEIFPRLGLWQEFGRGAHLRGQRDLARQLNSWQRDGREQTE